MKVSRIIYLIILTVMLIAVVMALRAPSARLVPVSAQEAKSFDEKIASLELAHQQGLAQTAHIAETELTSKLQQGIDENAANPQGSVTLKAASVHLQGDEFVGFFTLGVGAIKLYLTMGGKLGVADGRLQIQPSSAKFGSLPIPASLFRSLLNIHSGSPEARERFELPEFIKDVHIEGGELLVESQ
ncbi:MAG: hypothetical protein WAO35_00640 [Terriglobia bacterium]